MTGEVSEPAVGRSAADDVGDALISALWHNGFADAKTLRDFAPGRRLVLKRFNEELAYAGYKIVKESEI